LTVKAGDRIAFAASKTIDMWPNCEETKVAEGYPDINCGEVHKMGPDGTDLFPMGPGDYPMPGVKVMALVGRVAGGAPFLVGRKASFQAQQDGTLQLTANDADWRKEDDRGAYQVVVKGPGGSVTVFVR
jgi:hypothetical protein